MLSNTLLQQTLNNVDWLSIVSKIESHAHFETTKEALSNSPFIHNNDSINTHYQQLKIIEDTYNLDSDLVYSPFHDLKDKTTNHFIISSISKDIVADFEQLNFIVCLIENIFNSKSLLKNLYPDDIEKLLNNSSKLKQKIITPLRKFISREGDVSLEKHPTISLIYRELIALDTKIRQQVQEILRSDDIDKRLQFKNYDIINDRFVIPIRSDSYNAKIGIIVSRSSTGSTLFVEPYEVRNLCNTRLSLMAQLDAEINRVCQNFTNELKNNIDLVETSYRIICDYDYKLMQIRFSVIHGFNIPTINNEKKIFLENFFHPLIEGCVPNTIEISQRDKGLIISGPNTGGKTVAIKSIILANIFLKFGFYVPATKADMYIVDDIFYFDSDYQDLEHGLSSFAGETSAILNMIENISSNSLIAADEIFNSTASDEASALALSIIDYLTNNMNAKVLISTHHQLLKTKMQDNESFISAHVEYDFETHRPTYKLSTGTPGSSMALEIFTSLSKRYDVPAKIIEDAQQILDTKYVTYEKLLQELSKKKSSLDSLLHKNRQLNLELSNQKKSMEGVLFLEKQKLYDSYKNELDKKIKQLEKVNAQDISKRKLADQISTTKEGFNSLSPNRGQTDQKALPPKAERLEINKSYFCELIKSDCKLLKLKGKTATVKHRGKTISVPTASLYSPNQKPQKNQEQANVTVNVFRTSNVTTEVDGRGMRLSEFQDAVSSALNSLIAGDVPYLTVIHGHGDGVLKRWLRNFLKNEKELSWKPDDGNDGSTRVSLSSDS
jgi:DNA mismatch repair protein MutS2